MTSGRRRCAAVLVIGLVGALVLEPLGAQEPTDTAPQDRQRAEEQDDLSLEVRGLPPTPQVLTVRPRGEPNWTRSIVDLVGRIDAAILGGPPPLELRLVPVEIPVTPNELVPRDDAQIDEETDGPTAGRSGVRDPPDFR